MHNNIEPLAASLWFQRIAIAASGELGSVENSLRHAAHLVQLAPLSFRRVLPEIRDEEQFESLLEASDLDTAARELFGPTTKLLVETSADDDSVRAVVCCALLKRAVDGRGACVASASLSAWANWLVGLRLEFGTALDVDPIPDEGCPDGKCTCHGAS